MKEFEEDITYGVWVLNSTAMPSTMVIFNEVLFFMVRKKKIAPHIPREVVSELLEAITYDT